MSALRKLAVCYLVSVSAFGLAAGLRAWPDAADHAARLFQDRLWRPAAAALAQADRAFLDAPESNARVILALDAPGPADGRTLAQVALPKIARPALVDAPPPEVTVALDESFSIAPDLPPMPRVASATPARPTAKALEGPPLPPMPEPAPGTAALTPEQARARARLAATLTPEMLGNFGLFIFVSKAARGPLAQRMYVFRKQQGGLVLLHDWAASTGREKSEVSPRGQRSFTATPAGLYQFDPDRMYRQYRSYSWDQDMPHAMFFNWQREGLQTGLAIHAATGDDVARLGQRASAGCVHLSPQNARTLFNLVKAEYRGQVPRFSIDANDTMSSKGKFAHRADGTLRMADGYRVLIDIEDYSGEGGNDAVALF
jgi:lipoprotein-anchoring transpeptidase ErfK/SrfK